MDIGRKKVEAHARIRIGREKVTGPRPGKLAVVRSRRWYDLRRGVGPGFTRDAARTIMSVLTVLSAVNYFRNAELRVMQGRSS
jgi:hypothetical protein